MDLPPLDPRTYAQLRIIADKVMGDGAHTIQPTGLLHEAWMRLEQAESSFEGRTHFYRSAALAMRQILIDRARRRTAKKRGGPNLERVTLSGIAEQGGQLDLLELDDLIEQLREVNPVASEVVLLRTFGGLEVSEVAETLQISTTTVKRHWRFAKGWLLKNTVALSDG